MGFGEPKMPSSVEIARITEKPTNEEAQNTSKENCSSEFIEQLKEIEVQVGLIDVWSKDKLDKDSKSKAQEAIKKLQVVADAEERKELVSDLEGCIGLIDVWSGDEQDKDAKTKAQELITELKKSLN